MNLNIQHKWKMFTGYWADQPHSLLIRGIPFKLFCVMLRFRGGGSRRVFQITKFYLN